MTYNVFGNTLNLAQPTHSSSVPRNVTVHSACYSEFMLNMSLHKIL